MKAKITGVFPERQRVVADWRMELFALYRKDQRVSDFVKAGMALKDKFIDKRGAEQVQT